MDFFLGEIRLFSFGVVPDGWSTCEGQTLPMSSNMALYSLLGTTYGGDGQTTFKLPDLRGRVPVGGPYAGTDAAHITSGKFGTAQGSETVTLTGAQLPAHTHLVQVQPTNPDGLAIKDSVPSTSTRQSSVPSGAPAAPNIFANLATPIQPLHPATVLATGGSAAHENRQPFMALNYCIAITGLYPARS